MFSANSALKAGFAALIAGSILALALQSGGLRAADQVKDDPIPLPIPNFDELRKGLNDDDTKGIEDFLRRMQQAQEEMRRAMMARARLGQRGFGPRALPPVTNRQDGRLGAMIDRPTATLIDQLDLPEGQGVILQQIITDSPAEKAGMKAHDILLELNGKKVPSDPDEVIKQVNDIAGAKAITAVVMRKGKKETIKDIKLPELKPIEGALEFPAAPIGGRSVSTSISRANDNFTILHRSDDTSYTVAGKVVDGKPVANMVQVADGSETYKYDSLEKVPEKYQDQVKKLLEMIGGKKPIEKKAIRDL